MMEERCLSNFRRSTPRLLPNSLLWRVSIIWQLFAWSPHQNVTNIFEMSNVFDSMTSVSIEESQNSARIDAVRMIMATVVVSVMTNVPRRSHSRHSTYWARLPPLKRLSIAADMCVCLWVYVCECVCEYHYDIGWLWEVNFQENNFKL